MKFKLARSLALVSLMVSTTLYANHPSFDCSKVEKNSTEGVICSSNMLMDLDRELSVVYKKSKKNALKKDQIKAHQRGWIKGRNDCWKSKDEKECIAESYELRIKELTEKYL